MRAPDSGTHLPSPAHRGRCDCHPGDMVEDVQIEESRGRGTRYHVTR